MKHQVQLAQNQRAHNQCVSEETLATWFVLVRSSSSSAGSASKRLWHAINCRLDIRTHRGNRAFVSSVLEINVTQFHILTWHALGAYKLHSNWVGTCALDVLEANIADLNFGRNPFFAFVPWAVLLVNEDRVTNIDMVISSK